MNRLQYESEEEDSIVTAHGDDVPQRVILESSSDDEMKDGFVKVTGLPENVKNEHLEFVFQDCGLPNKFRVIRDSAGKCKGYAFLYYDTKIAIQTALSHNNQSIDIKDGDSETTHVISVLLGQSGMRRVGGGRNQRANRRLVSSGVARGSGRFARGRFARGRFARGRFARGRFARGMWRGSYRGPTGRPY